MEKTTSARARVGARSCQFARVITDGNRPPPTPSPLHVQRQLDLPLPMSPHPSRLSFPIAILLAVGLVACGPQQDSGLSEEAAAAQRLRLKQTMGVEPDEIKGISIQVPRSRFAEVLGQSKSGSGRVEELIAGDADLDAEIERLLATLGPAPDRAAWEALLVKLYDLPSTRLLQVVESLLDHPDADLRGLALTVLDGRQHPEILPLMERALEDADSDVRLLAIEIAEGSASTDIHGLLRRAMKDDNRDVRQMALQAALTQSGPVRHKALMDAAASPQKDLALSALAVMSAEMSKPFVHAYLNALDHADPTVREEARDFAALTLDQTFESSKQALDWWRQNQQRYDEALGELDDPDA